MPIFIHTEQTLLGNISITEENAALTALYFAGEPLADSLTVSATPVLSQAFTELNAYLTGQLQQFSVPLAPKGTAFMQSVWQALQTIPYGTVASYKDIAEVINNPKATRAVGMANSKNPLPIFIPCHRVINHNGKLGGYSGGLDIKKKLLQLEQHYLMQPYKNLSGRSYVLAYKLEPQGITVQFKDDSVYFYSEKRTGMKNIQEMQRLALLGQGLNTFINQVVKRRYTRKIR